MDSVTTSHLKLQAKMWYLVTYNKASVFVYKSGRLYWTWNTNLYLYPDSFCL